MLNGIQFSIESTSLEQLFIVIISLTLGWNSKQSQDYFCSKAQPTRNFYNAGAEPVIYSIEMDFLFFIFKHALLIPHITH